MAEIIIMNDLYQGDLRLYKNFFQPVMKLVSKERIGGKLKRKYDTPKTPYQRLLDSGQISEEARKKLEEVYLSLNP
ncbi:transposase, partial [Dehalococcoidia bacterium]|nr:transposase [Dehalococcoidia bacterium]